MIIKNKQIDPDQVTYLHELLDRDLPENVKAKIEKELRVIGSGAKGEKDTAYYIDFSLKNNKNWAIIHDLRLEHNGLVAQIDHILINRMLDIYVIESKHFASGVSISEDGEFCYFYKNRPQPIPSPIEQNKRHIEVLSQVVVDKELLPTRLGIKLKPTFRSYVLVSPNSRVTKPKRGTFDTSMVLKADQFISRMEGQTNDVSVGDFVNFCKMIGCDALINFARSVAALHVPHSIDYRAKFGLENDEREHTTDPSKATDLHASDTDESAVSQVPKASVNERGESYVAKKGGYFCADCKSDISKKVAMFCFKNKEKFGGKAYCFDCQKKMAPS